MVVEHVPPSALGKRLRLEALERVEQLRSKTTPAADEGPVTQLRDEREHAIQLPALNAVGRAFAAKQAMRREQP